MWDALHAVLLSLGDRVRWDEVKKGYMYRGLARFAMPVGNADNIYVHLYNVNTRVPEAAGLDLHPGDTYVGLYLRSFEDLARARPFLQRIDDGTEVRRGQQVSAPVTSRAAG